MDHATVVDERNRLRAEVERLQVQLAAFCYYKDHPMKPAEDYATKAMGWFVASHPWASGAYTEVVQAMRAYAAACVREDRKKFGDARSSTLPVETP